MESSCRRSPLSLKLLNEICANLPIPQQCQFLGLNSDLYELRKDETHQMLTAWKIEFDKFAKKYFGEEEYYKILAMNGDENVVLLPAIPVSNAKFDLLGSWENENLRTHQQDLIKEIEKNIEWVRKHFQQQKSEKKLEKALKESYVDFGSKHLYLSRWVEYLSTCIHEEACFLKIWSKVEGKYAALEKEGQTNANDNKFHCHLMKIYKRRRSIFEECQEMMPYVDLKFEEWKMAIGKN